MHKILYIILLICFLEVNLYCQTTTDKKNSVHTYVSLSTGSFLFIFGNTFGIGVDYSRSFTKQWSLRSGIERLAINGRDLQNVNFDLSITTIPLQVKYNFKKLVFLYFGPSFEALHFKNKELSIRYIMDYGLGWRAGIGLEHSFYNGIMLSFSNFYSWNNDRFGKYRDYETNKHLGISFGIGYKF